MGARQLEALESCVKCFKLVTSITAHRHVVAEEEDRVGFEEGLLLSDANTHLLQALLFGLCGLSMTEPVMDGA